MPRKASIQIRRDTRANWLAENAVLKNGELGYETDTGILKIGDGTSGWNTIVRFANQNDISMLNERIDDVLTVSSNNIYGVKIDTLTRILKQVLPTLMMQLVLFLCGVMMVTLIGVLGNCRSNH